MDQKPTVDGPITPEETAYVMSQFKVIKMASMPYELD
jgi:hypothetical protein